MKKLLCLMLALVMLATMVSCGDDTTTPAATTAPSRGDVTPEVTEPAGDTLAVFKKADIANFKIVYSTELGEAAITAVTEFADRMDTLLNTKMTVTTDFILESNKKQREWEYEILVGNTNRPASAEFSESFRQGDYGYGCIGTKIVIYGGNDNAVKSALEAFALDILIGKSSSDVLFQSDWSKIESYAYPISKLTVNGAPIYQFEIIYPATSTLFEKEMASRLQSYVSDKTGYVLTIKADTDARATEHAFLIGNTKYSTFLPTDALAAKEGCVVGSDKDVAAYGADIDGVVNASKLLTSVLFDESNKEAEQAVTISAAQKTQGSDKFSSMTFNVKTADMNPNRVNAVINTIYKYMPDTVGLQEANSSWMVELKSSLSQYYGFVGEGRDGGTNGEHTPILYSLSKYELVESGTKWLTNTPDTVSKLNGAQYLRIFTWAVLKDKETGVEYMHVNTHLDTAGSEIRMTEIKLLMQFLQDYNDMAVVFTGDMNSVMTSPEMQLVVSLGFATVNQFESLNGSHVIGQGANVIDYVFVTKKAITLTYYTTDSSYYNGIYASDHFGYYAEFTVEYPADGLDNGWDVELSDNPEEWLDVKKDEEGKSFGDLILIRR